MVYYLLKKFDYPNPWFAWIPLVNQYAIAEVCATTDGKSVIQIFNTSIEVNLFRFYPALILLIGFIPGVGSIAAALLTIVCYGSNITTIYSILENKSEDEVKALGYVSGFIGLIFTVMLTKYRKEHII